MPQHTLGLAEMFSGLYLKPNREESQAATELLNASCGARCRCLMSGVNGARPIALIPMCIDER